MTDLSGVFSLKHVSDWFYHRWEAEEEASTKSQLEDPFNKASEEAEISLLKEGAETDQEDH